MEVLFNAVSLVLLAAAIATFVSMVREVFQYLNEEDRASLRAWAQFSSVMSMNRALGVAWKEHVRLFPKSRKRATFAWFLVTACLSVMGYQLWMMLGRRP